MYGNSGLYVKGVAQLIKMMNDYSKEVKEEIEELAENVGKDAVTRLKATSPKRTGRYARSWRLKDNGGASHVKIIIHNYKHYRLTHLLEYGYPKKNGKRYPAQPHVENIEKDVKDKFLKGVEKILESK